MKITGRVPGLLANKGSQQATLPSRRAMSMLKNPSQQTLGNYAKMTPSGATAGSLSYDDLMQMGQSPVVPALPDDDSAG